MDARFYPVFEALYDEFVFLDELRSDERLVRPGRSRPRAPYGAANLGLLVRDALERAIGRMNVQDRVRPDARYFLLVNFTEMIVQPLLADPEARTPRDEIGRDVEADTETVLRRALDKSTGEQLSGGDVLQAVADQYADLRIARYRVWN